MVVSPRDKQLARRGAANNYNPLLTAIAVDSHGRDSFLSFRVSRRPSQAFCLRSATLFDVSQQPCHLSACKRPSVIPGLLDDVTRVDVSVTPCNKINWIPNQHDCEAQRTVKASKALGFEVGLGSSTTLSSLRIRKKR